jgi:predicted membrane-bound dolichyl-phosphate-mannose-protein mannosyltransferase
VWTSKIPRRAALTAAITAAIVLLAFYLRVRAAVLIPEDWGHPENAIFNDEPIYMEVARDLSGFIRNLNLWGFISYDKNLEHPLFGKFLFALALVIKDSLLSARLLSVVIGTLTVLLIARRTPLGGFFLAVELLTVKYSSEVYLDAAPVFFVLLSILMYERSRKKEAWFYLSAVAGGLAFATKYTVFFVLQIVPILMLVDNLPNWKLGIKKILTWAAIAAAIFIVVNPPYWNISKLIDSFSFHGEFAQRWPRFIPWWYQFSLMWNSAFATWHPGVFLIDMEKIILVLGFLGFPLLLYRKRMMESLWFAFALMFLLAWPVKWAWYPMIFTPTLAMSGGFLLEELVRICFRSTKIYSERIRAVFSRTLRKLQRKF